MPSNAKQPYLLAADPDALRRRQYEGFERSIGMRVIGVADGEQARRTIQKEGPPAAVVCELALPKVDGFALLKGLRAEASTRDVPVVVASAFRELRNTATTQKDALGIQAMFAKSSPVGAIDAVLQRLLHKSRVAASEPAPAPVGTHAIDFDIDPDETFELEHDVGRPTVAQERWRLDRIAALGLGDDLPEDELLQKLVGEVASAFGVPVALVSLVLEDRQWFKSHVGLGGKLAQDRGTPRDWAFCKHVVEANTPLVVPDAVDHAYFASNPLVQDGTVRGYAGVPLATPDGAVMGTLCLIDTKPLDVGAEVIDALKQVGRRVAGELALREVRLRSKREAEQGAIDLQLETARGDAFAQRLELLEAVLGGIDEGVVLYDENRVVAYVNRTFTRMFGIERGSIMGRPRATVAALLHERFRDPESFDAGFTVPPEGPYAAEEVFDLRDRSDVRIRWRARPVFLAEGAGQLALFTELPPADELTFRYER